MGDMAHINMSPAQRQAWKQWREDQHKKICEFFGVKVSFCERCHTCLQTCDLMKHGMNQRIFGDGVFHKAAVGFYFVDDDHASRSYPPPLPPPGPTAQDIAQENARRARIAAERRRAEKKAELARAGWQDDLDQEHQRQRQRKR